MDISSREKVNATYGAKTNTKTLNIRRQLATSVSKQGKIFSQPQGYNVEEKVR